MTDLQELADRIAALIADLEAIAGMRGFRPATYLHLGHVRRTLGSAQTALDEAIRLEEQEDEL